MRILTRLIRPAHAQAQPAPDAPAPNALDQISTVVVLMLENASFDRMLGFLRSADYPIEGLTGAETVPVDPADPLSARVRVTPDANYRGDFNVNPADDRTVLGPAHDWGSIHDQMFRGSPDGAPINQGFIWNYGQVPGNTAEHARTIVQCFAPDKLPVLTTLAREFAVCDHWFCSVPGPTWPNRLFAHAASSAGRVDDEVNPLFYDIDTIYDRLDAAGVSWKFYFHDIPQALSLQHLLKDALLARFRLFSDFLADARNGTLPAYSFIEPRYLDFLFLKATDQHPPHDIALGEYFIADVYEALRASPQWEHSLLVILYDEHGGLYDHVPPPAAVNPDGRVSANPPFNFDRLGPRVPAVLVSPYIPRGTIDQRVYEHASLPALLEKRFNLPPLTRRDAAAQTFEANLSLPAPRADTPRTLPRPADPLTAAIHERSLAGLAGLTAEAVKEALHEGGVSQVPASDLQVNLVKLTKYVAASGEDPLARVLRLAGWATTEHDAADLVHRFTTRLFGSLFG